MGVTLKYVRELSNPIAPLKDQLFIASTNIYTWTVPDINGESRKKEEDEARRRKQEKKDSEKQKKQRSDNDLPPVRLLRVRCPVRCAFVSMIDTIVLPLHQNADKLKIYHVCVLHPSSI